MPDLMLSAVLAVRDEAEMLPGALASLAFCDEIVVLVDDRTTDDSAAIAQRAGARVEVATFTAFDRFKNAAIALAGGEWVLSCDADERVTPALAREITRALHDHPEPWAFRMERVNYFWGRRMAHGGWPETPIKLFRRDRVRYTGALHEVPDVPPRRVGDLRGELWHFSHRSITDNLNKTANYAAVWAQARTADGALRERMGVVLLRMAVEFIRRAVIGAGWRDGIPGLIEIVYQPFSVFCHHMTLWEVQHREEIARRYAELERRLEMGS